MNLKIETIERNNTLELTILPKEAWKTVVKLIYKKKYSVDRKVEKYKKILMLKKYF